MTSQTNTTSQAPAYIAKAQPFQGKVCRMDDLVGKDFKILAFRDLPLSHQLSIAQFLPLEEGAEGETPASLKALLPAYLIQHGDDEWGVLNIEAERLKQSVMADEDRATGSETWEEYTAAYCAGGDVPHYDSDDRWPVLLSADNYETLLDGWHRMHSYMRSGAAHVPAIFAPEERHYELIGARKGNEESIALAATYALTREEVSMAIAGHNLRTFKGWTAAASALLADAPLLTGIQDKSSPYVILKAEFDGKPEVVFFYNETNGVYSPDLASDFDSSAWCDNSWDGVNAETNIATLTSPDFVTLRRE